MSIDSPLFAGEAERVVGALTATESVVEAAVDANETLDPVRSSEAASRGRGAVDDDDDEVGAPLTLSLAASWLSEGNRAAFTVESLVELLVIVVVQEQDARCTAFVILSESNTIY